MSSTHSVRTEVIRLVALSELMLLVQRQEDDMAPGDCSDKEDRLEALAFNIHAGLSDLLDMAIEVPEETH